MADVITKKDLDQAVADVSQIVQDSMKLMGRDVAEIKTDVKDLQTNVKDLQTNVEDLQHKHRETINLLDTLAKNLSDFTTEMRARDAEVARLKRWVEQIAEQTGVKLEY